MAAQIWSKAHLDTIATMSKCCASLAQSLDLARPISNLNQFLRKTLMLPHIVAVLHESEDVNVFSDRYFVSTGESSVSIDSYFEQRAEELARDEQTFIAEVRRALIVKNPYRVLPDWLCDISPMEDDLPLSHPLFNHMVYRTVMDQITAPIFYREYLEELAQNAVYETLREFSTKWEKLPANQVFWTLPGTQGNLYIHFFEEVVRHLMAAMNNFSS